jgi:hypothetical protein
MYKIWQQSMTEWLKTETRGMCRASKLKHARSYRPHYRDRHALELPFVAGSRLALSISSTSLDKDAFDQPVGADCGHRQRNARHRILQPSRRGIISLMAFSHSLGQKPSWLERPVLATQSGY